MAKLTEKEEKRDNELLKRKEKEVDEFQEIRKFLQDLKEELHILQDSNGTARDEVYNTRSKNLT